MKPRTKQRCAGIAQTLATASLGIPGGALVIWLTAGEIYWIDWLQACAYCVPAALFGAVVIEYLCPRRPSA